MPGNAKIYMPLFQPKHYPFRTKFIKPNSPVTTIQKTLGPQSNVDELKGGWLTCKSKRKTVILIKCEKPNLENCVNFPNLQIVRSFPMQSHEHPKI